MEHRNYSKEKNEQSKLQTMETDNDRVKPALKNSSFRAKIIDSNNKNKQKSIRYFFEKNYDTPTTNINKGQETDMYV